MITIFFKKKIKVIDNNIFISLLYDLRVLYLFPPWSLPSPCNYAMTPDLPKDHWPAKFLLPNSKIQQVSKFHKVKKKGGGGKESRKKVKKVRQKWDASSKLGWTVKGKEFVTVTNPTDGLIVVPKKLHASPLSLRQHSTLPYVPPPIMWIFFLGQSIMWCFPREKDQKRKSKMDPSMPLK